MRILHILDHSIPLHSGYSFRTLSILREQQARGWETFHLTSEKHTGCTVPEETVDGWHFYRTPPSDSYLSQLPVLNQVAVMNGLEKRLAEVIQRVQPDILHAHSPVLNVLPALRVARRLDLPVLYEVRAFWEDAAVDHGTTTENSLRYRLTRGLDTHAFRRVQAITTICEGLRDDIVARGVSPAKVTIIPNAVDVENFSMDGVADPALRERLGLTGSRVLGFVGSFYAYEGLGLLIRALPALLAEAPDVKLLLVGGGPEEERLKAAVRQQGLDDHVVFPGRVPHQSVQDYYNLIHILVYPRLSMRLTELVTPLKPLEAMAQGRVFLASDVGGHKELIRDGETGVLFKAGDEQDLAHKALRLLKGELDPQVLRLAGRRFVENERTWKRSVSRYEALYQSLLTDKVHA